MARSLRIEYPGAFYHVMNRGQSRRNIFMEDKGRQSFLDLLAEIVRLWGSYRFDSSARRLRDGEAHRPRWNECRQSAIAAHNGDVAGR